MKQNVLLLLTFVFLFVGLQPAEAVMRPANTPSSTEEISAEEINNAKEEWKEMSRKEKKEVRKQMRKDLKKAVKESKEVAASDTNTLLLVLVTILLPPLGMFLYDGASNRFLISLLLTLLFYVPGLIYTLVVILGGK